MSNDLPLRWPCLQGRLRAFSRTPNLILIMSRRWLRRSLGLSADQSAQVLDDAARDVQDSQSSCATDAGFFSSKLQKWPIDKNTP